MKHIFTIATASVFMALPSAFAAEDSSQGEVETSVEYDKDGGYESERSTSRTTAAGTKHTTESSTNVDVDRDGSVSNEYNVESVKDPKGLLNKQTKEAEVEFENKENGGYKQTTTREHTDANGTNTTLETVTDVTIDNDGNVTTTATTERTVDPKGLMNSKTTKSTSKTVNGKLVEQHSEKD